MSITDDLTKVTATVDTSENNAAGDSAGERAAATAAESKSATPTGDAGAANTLDEPADPDLTQLDQVPQTDSEKSLTKSKSDKNMSSPAAKAAANTSNKSGPTNAKPTKVNKSGRNNSEAKDETASIGSDSAVVASRAPVEPAYKPAAEGLICENWEELDQEQIDKSLKTVKITGDNDEDDNSVKKINNAKLPVTQVPSMGNEPQKKIQILRRQQPDKKPIEATMSANVMCSTPAAPPVKTFEQREQEYAQARLRILGSAHPIEEPTTSSSSAQPELTTQISTTSSNGSNGSNPVKISISNNAYVNNMQNQQQQQLMSQHQLSISQNQLASLQQQQQYQSQQHQPQSYHQNPLQHVPSAPSKLFSFNPTSSSQNQYPPKYNNSNLSNKNNQHMFPDQLPFNSNVFNQKIGPPPPYNNGQQLGNNSAMFMMNSQKGQGMTSNMNAGGSSFNPNHQMKNFPNYNTNMGYNFTTNIPPNMINNSPGIIGCPPSGSANSNSNYVNYSNPSQINVIRDPVVPDGTRGFNRRNQMQPNNSFKNNGGANSNAFYLNNASAASSPRDYKAN